MFCGVCGVFAMCVGHSNIIHSFSVALENTQFCYFYWLFLVLTDFVWEVFIKYDMQNEVFCVL